MKRTYYFIILASLLIAIIPAIVYSYPSTTEKQNIQQMINRGDPLRQAYQQAVKKPIKQSTNGKTQVSQEPDR